jgi:hypothetical protein
MVGRSRQPSLAAYTSPSKPEGAIKDGIVAPVANAVPGPSIGLVYLIIEAPNVPCKPFEKNPDRIKTRAGSEP